MNFWFLVQIFINIVLFSLCGFLWFKLNRPQKDDPRMSRGLQILGSKISILEDLADRTESQVKQLNSLMEQKAREIQSTILEAEKQNQKIEASMLKSLEVAKIFQDKIPHQEIIERQNTKKYVQAARMAHRGASIEEIVQAVDLPRGELEFIAKVNRDQLQFSESELPDWAKGDLPAKSFHDTSIHGDKSDKNLFSQNEFINKNIIIDSMEDDSRSQVAHQGWEIVQGPFSLRSENGSNSFMGNSPAPTMGNSLASTMSEKIGETMGYEVSSPKVMHSQGANGSPTLQGLGEQFRKAMTTQSVPQTLIDPQVTLNMKAAPIHKSSSPNPILNKSSGVFGKPSSQSPEIKKVIFPKIE